MRHAACIVWKLRRLHGDLRRSSGAGPVAILGLRHSCNVGLESSGSGRRCRGGEVCPRGLRAAGHDNRCLPPSFGGPAANNSTAPLAMGSPISTGNQVTSSVPEELSPAMYKSPAGFTVTVNAVSIPVLIVQLAQVYVIPLSVPADRCSGIFWP
jgi:hypothetical protein